MLHDFTSNENSWVEKEDPWEIENPIFATLYFLDVLFSLWLFTSSKKTTKAEQQASNSNNETFTIRSYNNITIILRDSDKHINATEMCKQFNRRFAKINENWAWQQYLEMFTKEYNFLSEMGTPFTFSLKVTQMKS
jgi:hypothetical protein